MHPRVGLALLATRAHCWLTLSLPSIKIPRCLSAGLHSSLLSNLYAHLEWHHPRCWIWHLSLSNFIWLVIAQCSSLPRSLYKTSWLLRESTVHYSATSENEVSVHSTSVPRSLIRKHWRELALKLGPGEHHYWLARCYPICYNSLRPTSQPTIHLSYCMHSAVCLSRSILRDSIKSFLQIQKAQYPLPSFCLLGG